MTHTNQAEKIEQSLRKLVDSIATARQGEGATLPSGLSARQWALIDEAAQSLVAAVAIARQEFSGTPHYGPDPQIDRRCAALLGWHRGTGGFESPSYWYNQRGQEMGFVSLIGVYCTQIVGNRIKGVVGNTAQFLHRRQ